MNISPPLEMAFQAAETESQQLNKTFIDSTTLTLGILQEATSPTANLLVSQGIDIFQLRLIARRSLQNSDVKSLFVGVLGSLLVINSGECFIAERLLSFSTKFSVPSSSGVRRVDKFTLSSSLKQLKFTSW